MIRVGPAGWSYADWEGGVYPREKPKGFHALPFLARTFDLMELNASFYRTPRRRDVERWTKLIEPFERFRFTAKLRGTLTHDNYDPEDEPALSKVFAEARDALLPLAEAGRMQALLAQFPASFRATDRGLRRIAWLRERVQSVPLVCELRHVSWFREPMIERLRALDVAVAWIDLPASKLHPPLEPPVVASSHSLGYFRIHGRNASAWFDPKAGRDARYDYHYDRSEVLGLSRRIERLASGVDDVAVVTNNHFSGKAVANGIELIHELGGPPPVVPRSLVDAFPGLETISRPEGQAGLFS